MISTGKEKSKTSSFDINNEQKSIVSKEINLNEEKEKSCCEKDPSIEKSERIDFDKNFSKSKNMQSCAKTDESIYKRGVNNLKSKKYRQRLNINSGYVNEDIIEENEISSHDSSGIGSSCDINVKVNKLTFNRQALKQLPPIPQQTVTGSKENTSRSKTKRSEEIDNIISSLKDVVNEGNPRDKYTYIKQIAKGRDGCIVCSGKNIETGENVAIKMQAIGIYMNNDSKYLKLELTILNGKEHPNLIKYYDSYIVNKILWIIMEQIEGGPLHYLIEEVDLLEEDIKIISKEILKGLEFLHSNQIIHRDIKSNNIMFSKDGEIKIIDFGLSAKLNYLDEKKNSNVGNDYYKSPELLAGDLYNNKTDIWSFGILVNEMHSGKPPNFEYSKRYAAEMTLKNGRPSLSRKASDDFQDFYNKCVESSPENRFSASQLSKHKFLKSTGSTRSLIPKMRHALREKRRQQTFMYQ